jgi:hypothetical protein
MVRVFTLPYFLTSDFFHGSNIDTFLWSYCAYEFANRGYVSKELENYIEFSTEILNPMRPYLQGCYFSSGYTLIAYSFFKIFGNLYFMNYINFVLTLISVFLMYLILKRSYDDPIVNSIILLLSTLNTYVLIFALKIRPDIFSFIFALLAWYLIILRKYILAGLFLSISAFLFKFQMITWVLPLSFIVWSYSRNFKNIFKFLVSSLALSPLYLILFLYAKINDPGLVDFLYAYNTAPIQANLVDILNKFRSPYEIIMCISLLSPTGLFYILSSLPTQIFPPRAFQSVFIVPFGLIYVHKFLRRFPKMGKVFIFLALPFVLSRTVFDLYLTSVDYSICRNEENYLYTRIIDLSENGKVCQVPFPYLQSLSMIGVKTNLNNSIWVFVRVGPVGKTDKNAHPLLELSTTLCPQNSYRVIRYYYSEGGRIYHGICFCNDKKMEKLLLYKQRFLKDLIYKLLPVQRFRNKTSEYPRISNPLAP